MTVLLILTLGIAAMSAMFSLVEGILLRRCRSAIRNAWFWWPGDTFVDFDLSPNGAIKKLRQAMNDDSENPRFVETC